MRPRPPKWPPRSRRSRFHDMELMNEVSRQILKCVDYNDAINKAMQEN